MKLGVLDFIEDQFFGGSQRRAAQTESDALVDAARLQYAGLERSLGVYQNEAAINRQITAPYRNAGYRAVGEMERQLGLTPSAPQGGFQPTPGTTFGTPLPSQGFPDIPNRSVPSGGSTGAGIGLSAALLAARIPAVRNAVGDVVGGAARGAGRLLNRGGGSGGIAGEVTDASGRIIANAGSGSLGAGTAGTTYLGPGGAAGPAPGPLHGGTPQLPGHDFGSGSAAVPAAPAPSQGILGRVFQGSNQYSNNLLKFGTPAVAGALAGFTTDGSKAKRAGAGIGAAAGQYFGGPIGSFIGSKLGGAIGGQVRSRNDRFGVQYDPRTGTLFDEGGTRLNEGDLRDYQSNLNPSADYPGHYELPGASLDGHSLLIDSQGNIVSGTNGSGLTGPLGNVLSGDAPVGLSWNGQNVTNTGGGHPGYGQYDPSQFQQPVQQPTIGIPAGEGPGGFLGGTQVIPENGLPPDVGEAIPGLYGPAQPSQPIAQQAPQGDNRYGAFEASPGYQFQLDEGLRAIQRSAAARGGLLSGRTLREMTGYAEGVAAQDYGNYFNRLQNVANLGAGQDATAIQAGTNLANLSGNATQDAFANVGNAVIGGGIARASGITGGNAQSAGTLGTIGSRLFSEFFA